MTRIGKIIAWIVVIVVVIWGLVAILRKDGGDVEDDKPVIKIGTSLPLTGNLAFLGENYRDAINLAISSIAEDSKYQYEVVFEDDKFNPVDAASAVNKLINVDKVDFLMSFGSPVGNVVSPIAETNKIIHINGIASDPNVAKGDYNFVHWTPPYEESKLMVEEMKKRGISNVILFEQNQPGVLAVTNSFRKDIVDTDIKIVAEEKFNTGETDFRSQINKVKNIDADIILLEATSPELEILAKQIRDSGISTPFTSVESFEFTDKPQLFEGAWYVNAADQSQIFIDTFTNKYMTPPKLGGGNGYDIINMIVYAVEGVGDGKDKPATEEVRKKLSEIKGFNGAMGELSVDNDGIVITKAVVRMIKDGKPSTVNP